MRQHSVSQHEDGLSFNFNEETFRGVLRNISFGNMEKAMMSRPKKCLVKCYLEEETMQRRMNGIFAGERDKVYSLLETVCFCYRLVSLAFFFTFLAFMLPFPRLCLQGRAYLLGIHLALF